jgi:hypothetical protein
MTPLTHHLHFAGLCGMAARILFLLVLFVLLTQAALIVAAATVQIVRFAPLSKGKRFRPVVAPRFFQGVPMEDIALDILQSLTDEVESKAKFGQPIF